MEKKMVDVRGMTCAACALRIEKTVGKLPGVTQANVNLASEKLFVEYNPETVNMEEITKAVEKIGYEAVEQTDAKTVTVPIGGMTCAACSQRIEKTLRKLPGVDSATVNLATEKATLTYQPQQIRFSAIREVIEKIGYQVLNVTRENAADEDRARKQKQIRTL